MSFIITECAAHGTKECGDIKSLDYYASLAIDCAFESAVIPVEHNVWHEINGTDCWVCCDEMITDPEDVSNK